MAGNWQAAEDASRKLIEFHQQAATPGLTTKPLMNLSNLFYLLGRLDEAWAYAQAATHAARPAQIAWIGGSEDTDSDGMGVLL